MKITEAFKRFTDKEIPPYQVYFLDTRGKLHAVLTKDIPLLEASYIYFADTSELPAFKEDWARAGHIPMLQLKEFE